MKKLTPIIDMIEHGNSKGALDALEKLRDEDREKSKCVEEIDMEEHISDFAKVWIRLDNFQRETITDALKISEAQNTERVRTGIVEWCKNEQRDCRNLSTEREKEIKEYNRSLQHLINHLTTPDHDK